MSSYRSAMGATHEVTNQVPLLTGHDPIAGEAFNIADNDIPSSWADKWPLLARYYGMNSAPPAANDAVDMGEYTRPGVDAGEPKSPACSDACTDGALHAAAAAAAGASPAPSNSSMSDSAVSVASTV